MAGRSWEEQGRAAQLAGGSDGAQGSSNTRARGARTEAG